MTLLTATDPRIPNRKSKFIARKGDLTECCYRSSLVISSDLISSELSAM